jgi:hypothetical protein
VLTRHSGHPYRAADHICRRDITDQVTVAVLLGGDWVAAVQAVLDRCGVTGVQRDPFFQHAKALANQEGIPV